MATPYVTGSAALLWRQCRDCSNNELTYCLQRSSFKDLQWNETQEESGSGYGLLQTDKALACLSEVLACCRHDYRPSSKKRTSVSYQEWWDKRFGPASRGSPSDESSSGSSTVISQVSSPYQHESYPYQDVGLQVSRSFASTAAFSVPLIFSLQLLSILL